MQSIDSKNSTNEIPALAFIMKLIAKYLEKELKERKKNINRALSENKNISAQSNSISDKFLKIMNFAKLYYKYWHCEYNLKKLKENIKKYMKNII